MNTKDHGLRKHLSIHVLLQFFLAFSLKLLAYKNEYEYTEATNSMNIIKYIRVHVILISFSFGPWWYSFMSNIRHFKWKKKKRKKQQMVIWKERKKKKTQEPTTITETHNFQFLKCANTLVDARALCDGLFAHKYNNNLQSDNFIDSNWHFIFIVDCVCALKKLHRIYVTRRFGRGGKWADVNFVVASKFDEIYEWDIIAGWHVDCVFKFLNAAPLHSLHFVFIEILDFMRHAMVTNISFSIDWGLCVLLWNKFLLRGINLCEDSAIFIVLFFRS